MQSSSHLDWFLTTCLRSRWEVDAIEEAIELSIGIDWDMCLYIAEVEFITPLLYAILKDKNVIPGDYERAFATSYLRNRSRNIILLNEFNKILNRLQKCNIPVIVLKGVALMSEIYTDIGIRPLTDLDLLLKPGDVSTALQELFKMGYQPGVESGPEMRLDFDNEIMLTKPGEPPYYLEIHWKLIDSPYYQQRMKPDWLWETASLLKLNGWEFLGLSREAQVLHLCAHLHLHHRGEELLWLNDIAELVMRAPEKLDWEMLFRMARENDLVLPIKKTFTRLREGWRIQLPLDFALQLDAMEVSPVELDIYTKHSGLSRGVAQRFWDDLLYLPDWSSRFRFAFFNLFPTPTYMKYRYHVRSPLMVPLYYLYRWYLGIRSLIQGKS